MTNRNHLLVLTCCFLTVVAAIAVISHDISAQSTSSPTISSLSSSSGGLGALIAVRGGSFSPINNGFGSYVYLNETEIETFYDSALQITFVVPINLTCGDVILTVRNVTRISRIGNEYAESNPQNFKIQCTEVNNRQDYAPPQIDSVAPNRISASGSDNPLIVKGTNLLPMSNTDDPDFRFETVIDMTHVLSGQEHRQRLGYQQFGTATYMFPIVRHCGLYRLEIKNRLYSFFYSTGNTVEIEVTEDCEVFTGRPVGSPDLQIRDIILPDTAIVGEDFELEFEIFNNGTGRTTPISISIQFDRSTSSFGSELLEPEERRQIRRTLRATRAGEFDIEILANEVSETRTIRIVEPTVLLPPNLPPPTSGGGVADYDLNNNCQFEDSEFFRMVDAWISQQIDDALFFEGVDAWIGQFDMCASAAGGTLIHVTTQIIDPGLMRFSVDNLSSSALKLEVFNLHGKLIHKQNTLGRQLVWNMSGAGGKMVSNGIYLYRVLIRSANGEVISSEVRQMMILR